MTPDTALFQTSEGIMQHYGANAVAIIGMSVRVPGADNLSAFWSMLRDGRNGVRDLTDADLTRAGLAPDLAERQGYVARAATVDDADCFDHELFGLSHHEAGIIDPQHRMFLQGVWSAFEHAGRDPKNITERCGVFASSRISMRLMGGGLSGLSSHNTAGLLAGLIGADKDYLATRAAFLFDLCGPAMAVQTACSSSLVAVHLAAQSLLNGECDLAIAGGVTVNEPQEMGYFWQEGLILSRDGICRPFDADASGTIGGNGCGVVVIKRLEDAVRDGDPVVAVIRGSAVNNDGAAKVGYTAPGMKGQIDVLLEAMAAADVAPASIDVIEAHGTGTALGDPIEFGALKQAFGVLPEGRVALGSVKANAGHMDAAAGVVSLIKAALTVRMREIPPMANFKAPNPALGLDGSGFYVPTASRAVGDGLMRAGVSSFGFGGTNAHVVIEAWPGSEPVCGDDDGPLSVALAAPDGDALKGLFAQTGDRLKTRPDGQAVIRAISTRRPSPRQPERMVLTGRDVAALGQACDGKQPALDEPAWWIDRGRALDAPEPVFVFSGQGSQRPGASRLLYDSSGAYRTMLHRCADAARDWGEDLVDLVLNGDEGRLSQMSVTQPVVYAAQLACVSYWDSIGVRPAAVMGQSFGEFAAAVTAGAMTPETGMQMILARSNVIADLPAGGAMASVHGDGAVLTRLMVAHPGVEIAAQNGPGLFVVSGRRSAIHDLAGALDAEGISLRMLRISHALHCGLMDPAMAPFHGCLKDLPVTVPALPFFSTCLGRAFGNECPDADYWVRHMRQPVLFAQTTQAVKAGFSGPYLDMGMDASAVKLLARNGLDAALCIPTLDPALPSPLRLGVAAGRAWVAGVPVDWGAVQGRASGHVPDLPGTAFAKTRFAAPRQKPQAAVGGTGAAYAAARDAVSRGAELVDNDAFRAGSAALETLSRLYLRAGLDAVGDDQVAPRFAPFVRRMRVMLEHSPDDGTQTLSRAEDDARALCADMPALYTAFSAIGQALPDIVTGARDPLEVLYSAQVVDQALSIYSDSPTARFFNPIIRESFRALLPSGHDAPGINVIEIGAGTGATAERLLPLLRPGKDQYLFTDISPRFVDQARDRLAEYGHAAFAPLDIGAEIGGQSIIPGSADIAIAVNVLHAAPDIDAALRQTAAVLAPGGMVIIDELTRPDCTAELSTGILISPVTDQRRGDQPFMTPDQWRSALGDAGFEDVRLIPEPDGRLDHIGEHIIMARRSGTPAPHEEPRPMLMDAGPERFDWAWHECGAIARDRPADVVLCRAGQSVPQDTVAVHDADGLLAAVSGKAGDGHVLRITDLRFVGGIPAHPDRADPVAAACQDLLQLVAALDPAVADGVRMQVTVMLERGAIGLSGGADGGAPDPVQAALFGLARVIAIGHPEFDLRILDIDQPDLDILPLLAPDAAISALRDGHAWEPRIVRAPLPDGPAFAPGEGDVALILGGTGGIGQKLAQWLVDAGCGRVYITGRAAPDTPLPDALQPGCGRIFRLQVDVTDPDSVTGLHDRLLQDAPDLSLIFHCAALTGPEDLDQADASGAFDRVLAPKTLGAMALDRISCDFPIRQFVLFSSSVSMAPTYGLPHYCAANACLDGLAAQRRAGGVPGLSVSWGAWSDAGVVAREGKAGRLERGGLIGFEAATAFRALARVMGADKPIAHLGLMKMDWPVFLRPYGEGNVPDIYASVAQTAMPPSPPAAMSLDPALRRQIALADPDDAAALLQPLIAEALAVPLGRAAADLPAMVQLTELGLDSLMFLDCATRLSRGLGIRVSPNAMFRDFTLAGVTRHFAQALQSGGDAMPQIAHDEAGRYAPFPLSDVQEAYWIGRSPDMDLGSVTCHGYSEIDCTDLDTDRLEAAWNAVLAAHDMLRAIIRKDGCQQVLALKDVGPYRFARLDLRDLDPATRSAELARIREDLSHKTTDASQWPLFEIRATRIDAQTTRIHFSLDNIIADGRSIGLVLQQWMAAYGQSVPHVSAADITFRDYMMALRAYRETPQYQASREYWAKRIETLPPAPALPRGRQDTGLFDRFSLSLDRADWAALRQLAAQKAGLTPSGLLLACYAEVLGRWSGQSHLTINVPTFSRQALHPDINEVVGEFTSMILLGVEPAAGTSFAERAQAVQARLFEDQRHDTYSGVQVMRDLARQLGSPEAAQMPVVFTSTFGLSGTLDVSYTDGTDRVAALGQEVFTISQTPQVLLDNHVHDRDGMMHAHWDYRVGCLPVDMLQQMFGAYEGLIRRLVHDPSAWDDPDPLALPQGVTDLWAGFNATAQAGLVPSASDSLGQGFLRCLTQTPDALALVAQDGAFDYAALGHKVGQWCALLAAHGVGRGDCVVISLPKSSAQIAATLAVILTGAAYVPVSPNQPDRRWSAILEQVAPVAVITQDRRPGCGTALTPEDAHRHDPAPLCDAARSDDIAYIIFTSGSTGVPKGVTIRHAAALTTLNDIVSRYEMGAKDRVFGVSDLSFDLSVFDIFATFAVGAALILPDDADHPDPAQWADRLAQYPVTIWNSAPAVLEIALTRPDLWGGLRLAMLSGDWIALNLPDAFGKAAPRAALHSLGGATEAGIWSVSYRVAEGVPEGWHSIPYGRPLSNQRLWVLDDRMRPCPPHVPGDLYIGGAALADGYWHSPDLTRAAFVTWPQTGERLYRTGDIAQLHPQGVIEFLGRRDRQVKVNGRRIETGEIEAALLSLDGVDRAIVAARSAGGGGARGAQKRGVSLMAWVSGSGPLGSGPQVMGGLRQSLARLLPPDMVPAHVIVLDRMPVTANGKIDMRALPEPAADDDVTCGTGGENKAADDLLALLCDLLEISPQQKTQNLFELGVSSLAMARAVAALQDRGHVLSLADFYGTPDLEQLCLRLAGPAASPAPSQAIAGQAVLPGGVLSDMMRRAMDFAPAISAQKQDRARDKAANLVDALTPDQADIRLPGKPDPACFDARYSCRDFLPQAPSQAQIGDWLAGIGMAQRGHDLVGQWGSGSSAFPLSFWVLMPDENGSRWSRYLPAQHSLRPAAHCTSVPADFSPLNRWVDTAWGMLAISVDFDLLLSLYGPDATHLAFLECGAVVQQLELQAGRTGMGCCQLGDLDSRGVHDALGLVPGHFVVHGLAFGLPDPARRMDRSAQIAPAEPLAPTSVKLFGGADHGDLILGDLRNKLSPAWPCLPNGAAIGTPDAGAAGTDLSALPEDLVLIGHSLGGLHAWALAHRLEKAGRPAHGLIVVDTIPFDLDQVQTFGGQLSLFARLLDVDGAHADTPGALWDQMPSGHAATMGGQARFLARYDAFCTSLHDCEGYQPPALQHTPTVILAAQDNHPQMISKVWASREMAVHPIPGTHSGCLTGWGARAILSYACQFMIRPKHI